VIKISVKREPVRPLPQDIKIPPEIFAKVGDIVIDSIQNNIENQKQANGLPIKANAPSTVRAKELRGQNPPKSLIDTEHRFMRSESFLASVGSNDVTVEPRSDELKEINREVQQKGYVGWFGINDKARALIKETIRRHILAWLGR
jgi:hypothetical protein